MFEKLIGKYVDKIDKQDIINFAAKNQIDLNNDEVNLIYDNIKIYWKDIVFNDHKIILKKFENDISFNTYNKIDELIVKYKNKYKNYL